MSYRHLPRAADGDIVIGDSVFPGSRYYDHKDSNYVTELPVAAGTLCNHGDIVTMDSDGYLANWSTSSTDIDGPGGSSDTVTIADLRNGAFMALAPVENTGADGSTDPTPVYGPGALVEMYLDAGLRVGQGVQVDARSGTTAGAKTELTVQVTSTTDLRTADEGTRRQRARAISFADRVPVIGSAATAGADLAQNPLARGYVGTITEILTRNADQGTKKATAAAGDVGIVQLREAVS